MILSTTNLGVLDVVEGGLKMVECADGVSEEELRIMRLRPRSSDRRDARNQL